MHIYVIQNDEQSGPLSPTQFDDLLQRGLLGGGDLYWHEGCEGWVPIVQHPGFPGQLSLVVPPPSPRRSSPTPSVRPASALKFCQACGHAVAPTAASCPSCGERLKMGCLPKLVVGGGAFVALLLVLSFLVTVLGKGTPQPQHGKTRVPPPTVAVVQRSPIVGVPLPEAETTFIDTVESYVSRYAAAGNELQKSAVRTERRAGLARTVKDMRVAAWVGTLKKLETLSDGKASISIQLEGSATSVHTATGNPFDASSNTMIEHGSVLYNKLAALSVGDRVKFSGSFLPGETDHLKETSFTESGSMIAPEFVMRFADVVPMLLDGQPTSGVSRVPASTPVAPQRVGLPAEPSTPEPRASIPATTASSTPPLFSTPSALRGTPQAPLEGPSAVVDGSGDSSAGAERMNTAEALLIGQWQGPRHLTEYRADHTRVMDGVNLDPPRTWHLDGDQLSEEPGKSVYKVVTLDRNRLILEGDDGKRYVHQRVQITAVNGTASQALDSVSSAWMTTFDFYDWYLDRDSQGASPWKDGSLAQRNDVSPTFATRSGYANEPEAEADPVLAGQHTPLRGFVLDAKVQGLVATARVRLVARDVAHELDVRLVRNNGNAPWQIDDVKPAFQSTLVPDLTNGTGPARTAAATPTNINQGFMSPPWRPSLRGPLQMTAATPDDKHQASESWPVVLYKGPKIPYRFALPGYWRPMRQPPDENADMAWESPKGIVMTAYSFDEDDTDDFWKDLTRSARIVRVSGGIPGQKPERKPGAFLEYKTVAENVGNVRLQFVVILRLTAQSKRSRVASDKLLALSVRIPPGLPQMAENAVEFALGYLAGFSGGIPLGTEQADIKGLDQRITAKNDPLLMELNKAVVSQNATPQVRVTPALLTKAQWKNKMARNFRYVPGTPVVGSAQQFQQVMGKPERTQTVGDRAYWYYQCSDGTIQLVMNVLNLQMAGLIQADVNDY